MKRLLITAVLLMLATPTFANQFEQLHEIEVGHKQALAAQQAEQQRQATAARARQQAKDEALRKERIAGEQKAKQLALQLRLAQQEEEKRLRGRDESFEDIQRELQIEEARLKLQTMKAKAARANDYIDAELRESAAKTDVIQSSADATRDVSSGAKSLLQSTGEADVNRSKKLFE
jgi:hypothetical protein